MNNWMLIQLHWKWTTSHAFLLFCRCEYFCFGKNKHPKRSKREVQTRHTHSIEVSFNKYWFGDTFGVQSRAKNSPNIVLDLFVGINSNMVAKCGSWVTLTHLLFATGLRGGRGRWRSTYQSTDAYQTCSWDDGKSAFGESEVAVHRRSFQRGGGWGGWHYRAEGSNTPSAFKTRILSAQ